MKLAWLVLEACIVFGLFIQQYIFTLVLLLLWAFSKLLLLCLTVNYVFCRKKSCFLSVTYISTCIAVIESWLCVCALIQFHLLILASGIDAMCRYMPYCAVSKFYEVIVTCPFWNCLFLYWKDHVSKIEQISVWYFVFRTNIIEGCTVKTNRVTKYNFTGEQN